MTIADKAFVYIYLNYQDDGKVVLVGKAQNGSGGLPGFFVVQYRKPHNDERWIRYPVKYSKSDFDHIKDSVSRQSHKVAFKNLVDLYVSASQEVIGNHNFVAAPTVNEDGFLDVDRWMAHLSKVAADYYD